MYARGQIVTLNSGQRYYRAPPGSLTPSVNRINDIPSPSRTPVYAPFFSSSPCSSPRPIQNFPNLPNIYSPLQIQYPISQNQAFEPFNIPNTQIRLVPSNEAPKPPVKSHIAAQCAPIKPSRTSGSFAVPAAKAHGGLTIRSVNAKPGLNKQTPTKKVNEPVSIPVKNETAISPQAKNEEMQKEKKNESKECKEGN